jgi:pimeloyl-ACP methyl ester carboxylesterase
MTTLTAAHAADLFRKAPDRHIDGGAGAVAYRRVGAGPDVLFVHGWPVSGATFRGLLPHLAPHVTCHLIDLVGAGQSRFDRSTRIDLRQHIASIRRVVDALGLESFAAVGHDSGGLMARHAMAGDRRLRSMALINTEQPQGLNWRFRQFLMMAKLPGFASILAWAAMRRGLRKNPFLLGDCFTDQRLLDGEFEEFFLAPLQDDLARRWAAGQLGRTFDTGLITELTGVHARLTVPVQLVWGENDPFFPLAWAREMVSTFPDARLHVVKNAKLFSHEERPAEVAEAILPALLGLRSQ